MHDSCTSLLSASQLCPNERAGEAPSRVPLSFPRVAIHCTCAVGDNSLSHPPPPDFPPASNSLRPLTTHVTRGLPSRLTPVLSLTASCSICSGVWTVCYAPRQSVGDGCGVRHVDDSVCSLVSVCCLLLVLAEETIRCSIIPTGVWSGLFALPTSEDFQVL